MTKKATTIQSIAREYAELMKQGDLSPKADKLKEALINHSIKHIGGMNDAGGGYYDRVFNDGVLVVLKETYEITGTEEQKARAAARFEDYGLAGDDLRVALNNRHILQEVKEIGCRVEWSYQWDVLVGQEEMA